MRTIIWNVNGITACIGKMDLSLFSLYSRTLFAGGQEIASTEGIARVPSLLENRAAVRICRCTDKGKTWDAGRKNGPRKWEPGLGRPHNHTWIPVVLPKQRLQSYSQENPERRAFHARWGGVLFAYVQGLQKSWWLPAAISMPPKLHRFFALVKSIGLNRIICRPSGKVTY